MGQDICHDKPTEIAGLPEDKKQRFIDHLHNTCCPYKDINVHSDKDTPSVNTEDAAGGDTTELAAGQVAGNIGRGGGGNLTSDCGKVRRVRRNVNSLSEAEKERLVRAMEALIESGKYENLGNIHGAPVSICSDYCCEHDVLLLPWHRLYMAQMEEELGEALPYWDWTQDDKLPDLWERIRAPIKEGASSHCEPGKPFITRNPSIEIDKELLKSTSRTALDTDNFEEFHREILNPHSILHSSVGCEMAVTGTGSYDPIFFLHHSYIDLLFAYWQQLQQLGGKDEPFVQEFDKPLPPFDRAEVEKGFRNENRRTLRNHRGRDTLNYKGNYCYEYDQLLFEGQTPAQFLRNKQDQFNPEKRFRSDTTDVPGEGKCGKVCSTRKLKSYCRAVCATDKDGKSLVKVFVGVVLPKEAPTGINAFDLCQDEKCVKAGSVGTFGKTTRHVENPSKADVDNKNYYVTEVDVTEVMEKQGWTLMKPLQAKMTSRMISKLPEPVVIVKELGNGGKVVRANLTLSPNLDGAGGEGKKSGFSFRKSNQDEKQRHYGNLLDKYST